MEYSSVAALSLINDLISRMQIIFLSSMEVLGAGGGGLMIGDGDGGNSKNVQHETFENITFLEMTKIPRAKYAHMCCVDGADGADGETKLWRAGDPKITQFENCIILLITDLK